MNVGMLISGFPPEVLAGAELQAQQVAEQLAERGHQVIVFTRGSRVYPSRMEQNGYTVIPRRVLPVKGARMVCDIGAALTDIARSHPRPEVLLCYQTIINGLVGVLAQMLMGIPAIVSVRGNREYRDCRSVASQLPVPFVYRKAKSIILQTPLMLEDLCAVLQQTGRTELSRIVREKARIIPNGIHLPRVPAGGLTGSKVIYIGRLVPKKGVADLIAAVKQLPNAELLVVGDGPDRTRLETMANGTATTFVGCVPHQTIAAHLREARVLVLPSHTGDGLPNVVLEAMSWGVPVVATNTAGIPDVVSHGETGYLYEPGDVGTIVAYVDKLSTNDELHHKLGRNGLHAVQSYSWDVVAERMERFLLGHVG